MFREAGVRHTGSKWKKPSSEHEQHANIIEILDVTCTYMIHKVSPGVFLWLEYYFLECSNNVYYQQVMASFKSVINHVVVMAFHSIHDVGLSNKASEVSGSGSQGLRLSVALHDAVFPRAAAISFRVQADVNPVWDCLLGLTSLLFCPAASLH